MYSVTFICKDCKKEFTYTPRTKRGVALRKFCDACKHRRQKDTVGYKTIIDHREITEPLSTKEECEEAACYLRKDNIPYTIKKRNYGTRQGFVLLRMDYKK